MIDSGFALMHYALQAAAGSRVTLLDKPIAEARYHNASILCHRIDRIV